MNTATDSRTSYSIPMPFKVGQQPWNKGKKIPFAHRKMKPGFVPIKAFKKGSIPWNKGLIMEDRRNENNPMWLGDKVKMSGLHDWVYVRLGNPSKCELCSTTEDRVYHWANKSGEYRRDIADWLRLCVPCHRKYDGSMFKAWITRKAKYGKAGRRPKA